VLSPLLLLDQGLAYLKKNIKSTKKLPTSGFSGLGYDTSKDAKFHADEFIWKKHLNMLAYYKPTDQIVLALKN